MNDERTRLRSSRTSLAVMGISTAALSEAAPSEGHEGAEPLDPEAMRREEAAWWTGVIDAHAQQRRDPGWAGRAEESFQADLGAIAPGRTLEVVGVDCRSTSCAATIRWPAYTPEVMKDAGSLAGHPYRERCTKSISVPPPEDPSAPYLAQIVFDCATQRAGLARR